MSQLKNFLDNIENHSNKFIDFEGNKYCYREIVTKSYDLARLLESYKLRKIYFNLKNSPLSICLYLAGWIADIDLFVPINPRLIDSELEGILESDSLFITYKPCLLDIINFDMLLIKDEKEFLKELPKTNDLSIYDETITAHVSSGTTGFYRKHCHTTDQIIKYANLRINDLGIKLNDHLLVALSLNHAFAFSYQLLPALSMGLNLTIIREFDTELITKLINYGNITALALLPVMYNFLINQTISQTNNLRYLSVAGDITSESLCSSIIKKFNLPLLNGIGMTEVYGYGQNLTLNKNNIIKIFSDTEVKIEKFDNNNYGKILIKNNTLPLSNMGNWLETGDIGSFDATKRELTFLGRYKDIIIKGGSNISPIELENIILEIKSIANCVVVGKANEVWGEEICAFIVSKEEYSLKFINEQLVKKVSEYKKLDKILYIEEIPLTSTGKTDRKKLKKLVNDEL